MYNHLTCFQNRRCRSGLLRICPLDADQVSTASSNNYWSMLTVLLSLMLIEHLGLRQIMLRIIYNAEWSLVLLTPFVSAKRVITTPESPALESYQQKVVWPAWWTYIISIAFAWLLGLPFFAQCSLYALVILIKPCYLTAQWYKPSSLPHKLQRQRSAGERAWLCVQVL